MYDACVITAVHDFHVTNSLQLSAKQGILQRKLVSAQFLWKEMKAGWLFLRSRNTFKMHPPSLYFRAYVQQNPSILCAFPGIYMCPVLQTDILHRKVASTEFENGYASKSRSCATVLQKDASKVVGTTFPALAHWQHRYDTSLKIEILDKPLLPSLLCCALPYSIMTHKTTALISEGKYSHSFSTTGIRKMK